MNLNEYNLTVKSLDCNFQDINFNFCYFIKNHNLLQFSQRFELGNSIVVFRLYLLATL